MRCWVLYAGSDRAKLCESLLQSMHLHALRAL
eukprot:SAG31_NODE_32879_length_350_cov_1.422311_1_plen_31_part_10